MSPYISVKDEEIRSITVVLSGIEGDPVLL